MKIAIIAEILTKLGGAERVVKELWDMFPEADMYTLIYDEKECGSVFPKEKIQTSFLQKYVNWGIPKQFLVSQFPKAIEAFDFDKYDLVISSSSGFAHGAITRSDAVHISYIHAPMRYAWDYTNQYTKEKTKGWKKILTLPLYSMLKNLRIWDFTASNRSDILLANSKTTQNRIQKYWRKDSKVIYPPVDIKKFQGTQTQNNTDQEYYLIVSALEGFKKIDIAVEAFTNMPEKKLIIAGSGSDKTRLENIASQSKNIEFVGRISDDEVIEYMQNMKAYIFPGLEDFGITPVEAMACGKPVIFYDRGGVSESVITKGEDKTGISFSHQTASDLQNAVETFENTSNTFDANIIRKRAEEFSTEIFKKNILSEINKLSKD